MSVKVGGKEPINKERVGFSLLPTLRSVFCSFYEASLLNCNVMKKETIFLPLRIIFLAGNCEEKCPTCYASSTTSWSLSPWSPTKCAATCTTQCATTESGWYWCWWIAFTHKLYCKPSFFHNLVILAFAHSCCFVYNASMMMIGMMTGTMTSRKSITAGAVFREETDTPGAEVIVTSVAPLTSTWLASWAMGKGLCERIWTASRTSLKPVVKLTFLEQPKWCLRKATSFRLSPAVMALSGHQIHSRIPVPLPLRRRNPSWKVGNASSNVSVNFSWLLKMFPFSWFQAWKAISLTS